MSNLLKDASILLTPTAYENGRMNAIKPEVAFGSELVTSFTNGTSYPLDTFVSSGNNITSLIKSNGFGGCVSNGSSYTANDKVIVSFTYTKNSGDNLRVLFSSVVTGAGVSVSNNINISESGDYTLYFTILSTTTAYLQLGTGNGSASINGSITNVSAKKDLSGDFTFSRNSAATRVNAQGLVENVQILSPELVSNGNFSQIGTEEVSNGNFSQEGSELVTNGNFATDSDWSKGPNWTISGGTANSDGVNATSNFSQVVTSFSGKTFLVEGSASNVSQGFAYISLGGTDLQIVVNSNGSFKHYVTISSGNSTLFISARNNFIGSIDNVSVKEVGQDWTLAGEAEIVEDGARIYSSSGGQSYIVQSVAPLTTSKSYKFSYEITDSTQGSLKLINVNGLSDYPIASSIGTHTVYFVADNSSFFVYRNSGATDVTITNISVKEVGQDWDLSTGWSMGDGVAIFNDTTTNRISQTGLSIISGKKYKIGFTIADCPTTAHMTIYDAGGSDLILPNENYVNGDYTRYYTAATNETGVSFWGNTAGDTFTITNISVKEITDDTDLPRINYEGFSYQDSLGSELITNGGFDTDSDWNIVNNTGTASEIINGYARIKTDGAYTQIDQPNVTIAAKSYKLQYTISESDGGSLGFIITGNQTASIPTTVGTHIYYFVANSTSIVFKRFSGVLDVKIDNVSVKEVTGQEVVPDSGCGSWLLEPQSTNLITYSEDFSQWIPTRSSVSINNLISPDGTLNATKISETSDDGFHAISLVSNVVSGVSHTVSVFIKKGTNEFVQFLFGTNNVTGNPYVNFDVNQGVFQNNGATSANIQDFGNGWYKCSITVTPAVTSFTFFVSSIQSISSYRVNTFVGNVNNNIYIYGAQLEQQSYATSYIPTNGAASTRLKDIATNSGNSTLINSTEGVLYAEIAALADDGTFRLLSLEDNLNLSTFAYLGYKDTSNTIRARIEVNGFLSTNMEFTLSNSTDFNKVAFKFSENDFALWVNGIEAATDTAGASFSANTLNSINFNRNGSFNFYGKNKALAVYKEALTDANLRCLTYPNPVATTFDLDFDTIAEQFTFTRGSEATFVNAQGLIESTASNDAPRIDYSTGAKAFLLEPQATNVIINSNVFTPNSNVILNTDNSISPDGTLNASKVTANSGTSLKLVDTNGASSGTYRFSVFAKKNTHNIIQLGGGGIVAHANFNLETGEYSSGGFMENYGNGWYRCSVQFPAGTPTSHYVSFSDSLSANRLSTSVSTGSFFLFGMQSETTSYATSYIPTSGASATRNQELCNNATPVINSEEGTLYAEISALADEAVNRQITLSDGNNNVISFSYDGASNNTNATIKINGVVNRSFNYVLSDVTQFSKIAIRYSNTEFSFWVNGVERSVNTLASSFTSGTLNKLSFGNSTNAQNFLGNTKGLKYYPKALADVQLEDLTTI